MLSVKFNKEEYSTRLSDYQEKVLIKHMNYTYERILKNPKNSQDKVQELLGMHGTLFLISYDVLFDGKEVTLHELYKHLESL